MSLLDTIHSVQNFYAENMHPVVGGGSHGGWGHSSSHSHSDPDFKEWSLVTSVTEANTDATRLSLVTYTKENAATEERELHGALFCLVNDLELNSEVTMGFAMTTEDQASWDGLKVSFVHTGAQEDESAPGLSFVAEDLNLTGEQPLAGGLTGLKTDSADWTIKPTNSNVVCEENQCRYTVHFMRSFETGEESDLSLWDGEDQVIRTLGFYEAQQPSGAVQQAISNEVLIELGASTLLAATSALVAGLLAFAF